MFTKRTYQSLEYSNKRENIFVDQANFHIKAQAFLGVIGLNMGLVHYKMYDMSVNATKFMGFLKELRRRLPKGEVVIYMDNLSVHKTPAVKEVMADLNFTYCMSPFYSPDYNPIEYYFSMLKRLAKRERL